MIRGQKGDRFLLNVINELKDDTMERVTSIVCRLAYTPIWKLIYLEALAWHFSERHELGGWSSLHYAVPYNSQEFVSVRLCRGEAGRYILVSFPYMYVLFACVCALLYAL